MFTSLAHEICKSILDSFLSLKLSYPIAVMSFQTCKFATGYIKHRFSSTNYERIQFLCMAALNSWPFITLPAWSTYFIIKNKYYFMFTLNNDWDVEGC